MAGSGNLPSAPSDSLAVMASARPDGRRQPAGYYMRVDRLLPLASGAVLPSAVVAYQTYGELNADASNAVLICHALTGDQFVADANPITGRPGWWGTMVGSGRPLDPGRYFIICSNVLGGCMGTTGPRCVDLTTGKPYGARFPVVMIRDMVQLQKQLIDFLGIRRLHCVLGGSMGGMQVLQWAASYPEMVNAAILIATAARHSPQNIALHQVGRQAIISDPNWHGGDYYGRKLPQAGLAVARMTAHISYLSQSALDRKFGRRAQHHSGLSYRLEPDFQVESYLCHQGSTFVQRFDANSYLYMTRAMDYFDLGAEYGGNLSEPFQGTKTRFCILSFTSDWLFPTSESREMVKALNAASAHVSFAEIKSDKGHDAFLLDEPEMFQIIEGFLKSIAAP